jgi:hypothetical protein
MEYYLTDTAFEICIMINKYINEIHQDLYVKSSLNKCEESIAEISLTLFNKEPPAFGRMNISLCEYDEGKLYVEVMALNDEFETEYTDLEKIDVDFLMDKYEKLDPVIIAGTMNRVGKLEGEPKRIISRTIEIRFRAFEKYYDGDEDEIFDIDMHEIAKSIVPYVKALAEISKHIVYGKMKSI